MLTRFLYNCFRKHNSFRNFSPRFKNILLQTKFRMNAGFIRKLPNSVFANIIGKNYIFHSLSRTTPNQNRRVVIVYGPGHPQYSTHFANRSPASICSRISNGCITIFAGYLSAKLAYGVFSELSIYMTETARAVRRNIWFMLTQNSGSGAVMYGQYLAAKLLISFDKYLYIFSNPFSQEKSILPKFNSPEILNTCVNESIDSSKQQSANNNNDNNNNNNNCINSSFVYFPKITGILFSLQNRSLILPHLHPNPYTIPRANPIHYNDHVYQHVANLPNDLARMQSITPKNPAISSLEYLLKSSLEKGNLHRKLGNFEEACRCFETAAEHGSADAMYNLGLMHCGKGGGENISRGMRYMESASKIGHAKAALALEQLISKQKLVQIRDHTNSTF